MGLLLFLVHDTAEICATSKLLKNAIA